MALLSHLTTEKGSSPSPEEKGSSTKEREDDGEGMYGGGDSGGEGRASGDIDGRWEAAAGAAAAAVVVVLIPAILDLVSNHSE